MSKSRPSLIPCSHTTAAGTPCRAYAIPNTNPPACVAHSGRTLGAGAPPGNQSARTHGFYSQTLYPQEIADLVAYAGEMTLDDEIGCARVALRRVLILLKTPDLAVEETTRLATLSLAATRTIARLLRDKRALSGEAADGISGAIAQALDELATEWGVDL